MKLIVGLGNPGLGYARNRHNIGFMCLRHFAKTHGIKLDKKQGKARIGRGEAAGSEVMLARPQTFMNHSGDAIIRLVDRLKLEPQDLIVIHDDMDLPLGRIRIGRGSGSGGHKGAGSIIYSLGRQDFVRVRVGIGRPEAATEDDIIAYVLSDFTATEKEAIDRAIPQVTEAINCLLAEGLEAAMNGYN